MPCATASKDGIGRIVLGQFVVLRSLTRSSLTIEDVVPDPGSSSTLSLPRYFDAGAVVEQCATGRIRRWIDQQIRRNGARHYPPVSITWLVALAIAPPRKLAKRIYSQACERHFPADDLNAY